MFAKQNFSLVILFSSVNAGFTVLDTLLMFPFFSNRIKLVFGMLNAKARLRNVPRRSNGTVFIAANSWDQSFLFRPQRPYFRELTSKARSPATIEALAVFQIL